MQAEATIPLTEPIAPPTIKPLFQKPQTEQKLEAPHYLFTALNTIDPRLLRERRERPELRAGGMLVSSPCLRHVDGFVRRGTVTALLENVYDPVAREEAEGSEQKGAYLELPPLPPLHGDPLNIPQLNPLKTRLAKPGLHLPLILNGSTNVRGGQYKGLVEVHDLRYAAYDPVEMDKIHRALYPTWPALPVRLNDLRAMLEESHSSYLASIVTDMLESCSQAELYMTRVIDEIHHRMENPSPEQMMPRYTGLHYVFLEQLGIEPKARTQQSGQPSQSPNFAEMFQLFREASKEDRNAFLQAMKEMSQPAPLELELEAATKEYACECGRYPKDGNGSVAGLRIHKSLHCELRNQEPASE